MFRSVGVRSVGVLFLLKLITTGVHSPRRSSEVPEFRVRSSRRPEFGVPEFRVPSSEFRGSEFPFIKINYFRGTLTFRSGVLTFFIKINYFRGTWEFRVCPGRRLRVASLLVALCTCMSLLPETKKKKKKKSKMKKECDPTPEFFFPPKTRGQFFSIQ